MAPKRLNPVEEPPAASSDEDEHSSSAGEEDDDSSSGEEDDGPAAPTGKNIPSRPDSKTLAPASARPEQQQSSDDEGSSDGESETESDSDAPPSVTVKPIATKPMEKEAPKPSKSSSKPAPPPAKSPAKRPTATEQREAKRAKKEDGSEETAKKAPFQRLWSEVDEIVLLKGMMDYSKMKGGDPLTQIDEFHEFIKKSFQFDFSRSQLVEKLRRLKKKYKDSVEKGKKGTKPHEQKSFDLSEKLWGNEGLVLGLESAAVSNGKARKNPNPKVNKKALASSSSKPEPIPSADGNKQSKIIESETELLFQCLSNPSLLDEVETPGGFEAAIMKRAKGVMGESKKAELEKKARKLKIAELELYLERKALIGEQAKMLLGHYKSLDK